MALSCTVRLIHCGILSPDGESWKDSSYRVNRIHLPLSGRANYRNSAGTTELCPGVAYLMVNGVSCDLSPVAGEEYRHLYLDFHTAPLLQGDAVLRVSLEEDPYLEALLRALRVNMEEHFGRGGKGALSEGVPFREAEAVLALIMAHLGRRYDLSPVRDPKVEAALCYIRAHYAEPIGNREIAASLPVDVRHLLRLFRRELSLSPYRYLSQYRVERACEFLRQGRPVSEIAFACGYRSESAFRQAFRRVMGTSPSDYLSRF